MDKNSKYIDITAAAGLLHDLGKFERRADSENRKSHYENSYHSILESLSGIGGFNENEVQSIAGIALLHHTKCVSENKIEWIKTTKKIKTDKARKRALEKYNLLLEGTKKLDEEERIILNKIIDGDIDSSSERRIFNSKQFRIIIKELGEVINREDIESCSYPGLSKNDIEKIINDRGSSEKSPVTNLLGTLNNILSENRVIDFKDFKCFMPMGIGDFKEPIEYETENVKENTLNCLSSFKNDMEILKNVGVDNRKVNINCINYIYKKHAMFVPASKWEKIRDVSLYNHSQLTAAIGVCRYIDREIRGRDYISLQGRIFNIQNYIYHGINSHIEKPMKRIFVRSHLISLLNIMIPYIITKKLGLFGFNILFANGGSFHILLPMTYKENAEKIMNEIKKETEDLFENKIFIEFITEKIKFKTKDDRMRYEKGFKTGSIKLYNKKYSRNIDNLLYRDKEEYNKCKNCGINYSLDHEKSENSNEYCSICSIENKWMESYNIDLYNLKINYEDLNIRNISCPEKFSKIRKGTPVICFSHDKAEEIKKEHPIIDVYEIGKTYIYKNYEKCKNCRGLNTTCDGPIVENKYSNNQMISLDCFSHMSNNDSIIATAKIDVDDFQFLLYHTYPTQILYEVYNFSVSRVANTSMLFNLFFAMHLRNIISKEYSDSVMIIYSGGDDILITGQWESIMDAVIKINNELKKFTMSTNNENNITISSSILFHKAKRPFNYVVKEVGELLERCKADNKNCINFNGNLISYDELENANSISNKLIEHYKEKNLNRLVFYKMKKLIDKASLGSDIEKMRAYAEYTYLINDQLMKKSIKKEAVEEINTLLKQLILTDNSKCIVDRKYNMEKIAIEIALRKSRERGEISE